jgi:hypothetical protein
LAGRAFVFTLLTDTVSAAFAGRRTAKLIIGLLASPHNRAISNESI